MAYVSAEALAPVFDMDETGMIDDAPIQATAAPAPTQRRSLFHVVCLQQRQQAATIADFTR